MNPLYRLLIGGAVVVAALVLLLPGSNPAGGDEAGQLSLYCAAGLRKPVEEIANRYFEEQGVRIDIQYGGSNTLLGQMEVGKTGDLYLAADESYLDIARSKGLVEETIPLAKMVPVVVVPRENEAIVDSVDDLLNLRLAAANPDQAAVGKATRQQLQAAGVWEAFDEAVRDRGVYKPTVGDVANDVALGAVDAGVVWDAVAGHYPQLRTIRLPELESQPVKVAVGVLASAEEPAAALRFARYLAAADRGLPVLESAGFDAVEGDPWFEKPEVSVFAGAVNRQALQPVLDRFAEREGVAINTVYNGCGILNAQMDSLGPGHDLFPDAYMPCDRYYLGEVQPLFEAGRDVSSTPIVIVVAKGNPKAIATLDDLAKPGVRVALGQPEQCTIGVLSRKLLEDYGLYEQLLAENVVTQTTSSSLLVPAVATGAADATLAYATDARGESAKVEAVAIGSPLARAVQQFSAAKSTPHKRLIGRMRQTLLASPEVFTGLGFLWEVKADQ
ncbi:MAG: molybdate ABC transporter substrate-binding protein [Planctomycetota bacterium]